MDIVVLAEPDDEFARLIHHEVVVSQPALDTILVSGAELALARQFTHSVAASSVKTAIRLGSGRVLESDGIGVVFNRLRQPILPHFASSARDDALYAHAETVALWLSWLSALPCPVINPATPRGMSAPSLGPLEWLAEAHAAGLPTVGYEYPAEGTEHERHGRVQAPTTGPHLGTVLVVGGSSVDADVPHMRDGLQCFASRTGCALLEVWLSSGGEGAPLAVAGATGFPEAVTPVRIRAVADYLLDMLAARTDSPSVEPAS